MKIPEKLFLNAKATSAHCSVGYLNLDSVYFALLASYGAASLTSINAIPF